MRFRSTLVPILALLASVRAAPSSGLQSREKGPFSVAWSEEWPKYMEEVKPGTVLTLGM
jgi:hypothetical protein